MTASDATRESTTTVLVDRAIPFCETTTADRPLELDAYRPADAVEADSDGADDERPIVVFVYGGGWTDGATGQFARYALDFAADGWIAIECSYRLADEARFPAPLVDVHAALDWLGDRAAAYGGDPDRLALVGHSAGAHLAALASLTREHPDLTPDSSSRPARTPSVAAVAGVSGVYDFDLSADAREDFATRLADRTGGPSRSLEEQRRLASPVTHVTADAPASLLRHGTDDEVVPPEQSERYRDVLEAANASVACDLVADEDHVFLHSSGEYPGTRARIASFFDEHV